MVSNGVVSNDSVRIEYNATYDIRWTDDARRAVTRIKEKSDQFWTDERVAQAQVSRLRRVETGLQQLIEREFDPP